MDQRGVGTLTLIVIAAIIIAGAIASSSLLYHFKINALPAPELPVACTQDAKQCPDGSYVSRTGSNCEFAACPEQKNLECTLDADCPSIAYVCQALEGTWVVYPDNEKPSERVTTKGECKLKEGGLCTSDANCASGFLCHNNACANPRGQTCQGISDASCPSGYTCIQSCGPPVSREGDPEPPYFCELNEVAAKPKICPICLAWNTRIESLRGDIKVEDVKVGDIIWSVDGSGKKIESKVVKISSTNAPKTHKVIHLALSDGREVFVSPNHLAVNGKTVGLLKAGDLYDGSTVASVEHVFYWADKTYDILPDSDTGYYFANGILLKSTLNAF